MAVAGHVESGANKNARIEGIFPSLLTNAPVVTTVCPVDTDF